MSYHKYDIDDFVNDPFFRKWILNPNPESNYFWEKWLLSNPGKKDIVAKAKIIVKTLRFKEDKLTNNQKSELLNRIKKTNKSREAVFSNETVVKPIYHNYPETSIKTRRVRNLSIVRYAAVIAGILIISASFFWWNKDSLTEVEAPLATVVKENAKGQKARIFLPDGSTVLLNASSKLTYPSKFSDSLREVQLSGEAFFEVVKDTSRPFFVRTEHLVTKVLGTSFNVKAFESSEEQSVALVTGKVEIFTDEDENEKLILVPGELAGYEHGGELVKRKYDYNKEILWKDGVLYFKETPFKEVLYRLEQWYGVDFTVENMPDGEYPVTGRFENEYLSNVLQSIGFSVKFDFRINGNEVYLEFSRKSDSPTGK